jgi:AcrR family transcriptional regulator
MGASLQKRMRSDQPRSIETKNKILNAAEELFSLHGFSGTSLRDIHSLSGVPPSLCHYHFGSKEDVLQAVVDRRSDANQQAMLELLDSYKYKFNEGPIPVEALVEAYVRPLLEQHLSRGNGWRNYTRLMAFLHSESSHLQPRVQVHKYGQVVNQFIEELRKSMPHANESTLHWGIYFLRSSVINLLLDTRLVDDQSAGLCDSGDVEEAIQNLQCFFSSGFQSVIATTNNTEGN